MLVGQIRTFNLLFLWRLVGSPHIPTHPSADLQTQSKSFEVYEYGLQSSETSILGYTFMKAYIAAFSGDTADTAGKVVRTILGTPRGLSFALSMIPFIKKVTAVLCLFSKAITRHQPIQEANCEVLPALCATNSELTRFKLHCLQMHETNIDPTNPQTIFTDLTVVDSIFENLTTDSGEDKPHPFRGTA